jgi:exopolysaccharide biosynthesis polyprenyl glycosylphosphotransferase
MSGISTVLAGEAAPVAVAEKTYSRFRPDALRRRLLALADISAVLCGAGVIALVDGRPGHALGVALMLPAWIVLAKLCGLYDHDHRTLRPLTIDEFPRVLLWTLLGSSVLMTVAWAALGFKAFSPSSQVAVWVVLPAATLGFRALARRTWRAVTPRERVVVIGAGELADAVKRKFHLFPDMHVELVGEHTSVDAADLRRGYLVGFADPGRIVVATETVSEELMVELLAYCRRHQIKLSIVPPARGMFGTAVELGHVADLPVIQYHTWDISRTSRLGKRILDVSLSTLMSFALAPLMVGIAIAIRLSSPGPVFFVQRRAGEGGRPFWILKFRTMDADAASRLDEVVDVDSLEEPVFKLADDPRVTLVGRFLRKWSLDELPQLWNVARGDMSLVGPRPEQLEIVARYRPEHRFRLMVKPGITGPMQVYGRGALAFEERLAVERDYVETFSLARDLRLLGLTLGAVVRRWGAY